MKHGPAALKTGELMARPGTADERILEYAELLGRVSDTVIAAKARVSASTVQQFRKRNRIPSCQSKSGVPSAPRRVSAARFGWRVTFRRSGAYERRIVVAPDVATALDHATGTGFGEVVSLERMDPVLD